MDLRRGLVARKPCTGSTETKRIHSRAQQGQRQPEATWDKRGHSFPWLCVCWPQEVCWTCRQDLSTLRSTWEVSTWGYRFFLLEQGFWASLRMDTYIPTFPKYRCLRGHRLIFGSHLVSILCGNTFHSVFWVKMNINNLLLSFPLASVVEISEIQDLQFISCAKAQILFCIDTSSMG